MNKSRSEPPPDLVDRIALELQRLRSAQRLDSDQPLLRIDNRREAAEAPFQFDIAESVLHRTGCPSIPKRSRSALYALWDIRPEDLKYACAKCGPAITQKSAPLPDTGDLIYGIFSLIDQFGSILVERGREYRASESGQRLEARIGDVIGQLDGSQQQMAGTLFDYVDGLVNALQDLSRDRNGRPAANTPANGDIASSASGPTGRDVAPDATRSNGVVHSNNGKIRNQKPKRRP